VAVARRLLAWAKERGLRVWWGEGLKDGSFLAVYDSKFGKHYLYSVWTYGSVEIPFQYLKRPPFDNEHEREELAQRVSAVGITIPKDALRKRPSLPLKLLHEPGAIDKFLAAFDWMLSEIRKAEDSDGALEPSSVGPAEET
jgi:hypothetical protein